MCGQASRVQRDKVQVAVGSKRPLATKQQLYSSLATLLLVLEGFSDLGYANITAILAVFQHSARKTAYTIPTAVFGPCTHQGQLQATPVVLGEPFWTTEESGYDTNRPKGVSAASLEQRVYLFRSSNYNGRRAAFACRDRAVDG